MLPLFSRCFLLLFILLSATPEPVTSPKNKPSTLYQLLVKVITNLTLLWCILWLKSVSYHVRSRMNPLTTLRNLHPSQLSWLDSVNLALEFFFQRTAGQPHFPDFLQMNWWDLIGGAIPVFLYIFNFDKGPNNGISLFIFIEHHRNSLFHLAVILNLNVLPVAALLLIMAILLTCYVSDLGQFVAKVTMIVMMTSVVDLYTRVNYFPLAQSLVKQRAVSFIESNLTLRNVFLLASNYF